MKITKFSALTILSKPIILNSFIHINHWRVLYLQKKKKKWAGVGGGLRLGSSFTKHWREPEYFQQ